MRKWKYLFGILALTSTIIVACEHDPVEPETPTNPTTGGNDSTGCDTLNTTFTAVIQPIINTNCAYVGCHAGSTPASGIDLSDFMGVENIANSGALSNVINHNMGWSPMPKGQSKLDDCSIAKIQKWVDNGAQNN